MTYQQRLTEITRELNKLNLLEIGEYFKFVDEFNEECDKVVIK